MDFAPELKADLNRELSEASFTSEQREQFFTLASLLGIHDKEGGDKLVRAAKRDLLGPQPEDIITRIKETSKILGIPEATYRTMVVKQPTLAFRSADEIKQSFDAKSEILGLDAKTLRVMVKHHPQILYLSNELIDERVTENTKRLNAICPDVTREDFVKASIKKASLCFTPPDKLMANIAASASALGVTESAFIKVALKQPTLFVMSAETLRSNMQEAAALLKIEIRQMVDAAMRSPSVFYLKPESINQTVEGSAQALGVEKEIFVAAALKQPPLFYLNPENVARHATLAKRFYREKGEAPTSEQVLEHPIELTRSDSALIGRIIVRDKQLLPNTPLAIMVKPNAKIEKPIREHYESRLTGDAAKDIKVTRTLQQLHRLGVISELPEGITPMDTGKGR